MSPFAPPLMRGRFFARNDTAGVKDYVKTTKFAPALARPFGESCQRQLTERGAGSSQKILHPQVNTHKPPNLHRPEAPLSKGAGSACRDWGIPCRSTFSPLVCSDMVGDPFTFHYYLLLALPLSVTAYAVPPLPNGARQGAPAPVSLCPLFNLSTFDQKITPNLVFLA